MTISELTNSDLKNFISFCKKNLPKSFIYELNFLNYWFKDKKHNWSIDIVKNKKKKILSINIRIINEAIYKKKIIPMVWTSTAFTSSQINKDPYIGLILYQIHKNNKIVGSVSPNSHSIKLNKQLGRNINGIKLQRYIFIHNHEFRKLIIKSKQNLFNKFKTIKIKKTKLDFKSKWIKHIPIEYNKLWKKFSSRFDLCTNKDYKFIKKRYLDNPFQKYDFLKVTDSNNKLVGLSIIRFQTFKKIKFARIIEFISLKKYDKFVWNEIIYNCQISGATISDFFVIGNNQNQNLTDLGFKKMKNYNKFYHIPNLLSPLSYRHWNENFHIGGNKINRDNIKTLKNIWFTKGDGDRDHPTRYDLKIK